MVRRKKSYNPLKMWGSYVGLILTSFFMPWYNGLDGEFIQYNYQFVLDLFSNLSWNLHANLFLFFYGFIIIPATGFMIGWGIHSLIRRLKK